MGIEIERKYLVKSDSYKEESVEKHHIIQGYLSKDPERVVRVRIKDDKGIITIKGKTEGCRRLEFEYEVPLEDALQMIRLCITPVLEKERYIVKHEGFIWEIDEFKGHHDGLVTAEVELPSENINPPLPDFIGEDVTGEIYYYNSNL